MQFHTDKDEKVFIDRALWTSSRVKDSYVVDSIPFAATVAVTAERVPFSRRDTGARRPVAEGEVWGADWETGWFHLSATVPEAWAGSYVVGWIDIGGEGLVYHPDGRAWKGITSGSVFNWAASRPFVDLLPRAEGGEEVELWLEAAANHLFGITADNDRQFSEATVRQRRSDPRRAGSFKCAVQRLRLARVDRAAWALGWDFDVLTGLVKALPAASVRRARVLAGLTEASNILARNPTAFAEARAVLAPLLSKPANASDIPVRAVGHAHIDTAWLWPLGESVRKTARTYASQLDLIERYPGYVFGASAPQHYAWMKEFHPDIFARVRKAVADGSWEPQGGMWVECDCNIPSGESLVRQFIHGKNFFRDEFGVVVDNLWMPDVFGYAASLPQIMAQCGVTAFLTQKISWNQYNSFPYHTFWWQGIDGTRVLTHFPPEDTYNGDMTPESLIAAQGRFREKAFVDETMSLFGVGDGGGGPREDMLERAARMADLEGCPPVRLGRARDFFAGLRAHADKLQTWVGELYLELHRGTLTTQARVKKGNRLLERRLRELEMLWASRLPDYPIAEFDAIWKETLTLQFHDIIPGSSINLVYKETHEAHERLLASCDALQSRFAATLPEDPEAVTFFNSLSTPFHGVVPLPSSFCGRVAMHGGQPVPTQLEECGAVALVDIPPLSFLTLRPGAASAPGCLPASASTLDNGLVRYVFDAGGRLLEAVDACVGRNLLAGPGNVLSLYHDRPNNWDAWDIDRFYRDEKIADAVFTVESLGAGPVRSRLRLSAKIGESTISQVVSLAAGSRRLDFETVVDWRETHRMLRVAFPADLRADRASGEIQYGHLFRPTHANTSWDMAKFEVPAQRWVDISEAGCGLALLNDCKYGHCLLGNVLDLNLLRSPTSPDPDADLGVHSFTYSLLPHAGALVDSDVIAEAGRLNQPPVAFPGRAAPAAPLPAALADAAGVDLAVIKRAERSPCVVIRLVEALGRRSCATVRLPAPARLVPCDLLEWTDGEPLPSAAEHRVSFAPFQIRTFKIVP